MATDSAHKRTKSAQSKLPLNYSVFCHEYISNGGNATQAAKTAGFSEKTAYSQGQRLLKKVEIQAKLAELTKKYLKKSEITAEDVVTELARVGLSNITDIIGWNESGITFLKNSDEIPPEIARTIESIQVTEDYVKGERDKEGRVVLKTKVKMHPKIGALNTLAKKFGLLDDVVKHEHSVGGELAERLIKAIERVEKRK